MTTLVCSTPMIHGMVNVICFYEFDLNHGLFVCLFVATKGSKLCIESQTKKMWQKIWFLTVRIEITTNGISCFILTKL